MDIRDQLNRFIAPVTTRMRNMIVRGVIKLVDNDAKIQRMQNSLLAGELKDNLEHYQDYGFESVPLEGMETLVTFCGGDRSNGVIVAVGDRKFRLKGMKGGEVALYTDEGDFIKLGRGRRISVSTLHLEVNAEEDVTYNTKKIQFNASESVTVDTPIISTTQKFSAGGDVSDKKGSMQAIRDTFNNHNHDGDSGGKTGSPNSQM